MSDNDKAIAHALLKLPPAERHAAFLEICDGKFDRAPRDRLAAWYSQEKRSAVLARLRNLPVMLMGAAWLRISRTSDGPDEILKELSPPASDLDAGHPSVAMGDREGNDDHNPNKHRRR
ncbi:MAG TPA: hypothetical protein VNW89_08945 [Stellaceae bacterium]|jgi:hypothetical protein|nr:hypothetical protein [Stellaceae bacterium]